MAVRHHDHPFLQFDSARHVEKFAENTRRKIHIPYSLDWDAAMTSGLQALIDPYLTYMHQTPGAASVFLCQGWSRLFQISEPIYHELVMEFFSTVSFDATEEDYTRPVFSFRLGRVERQISVVELARRLGIYTDDEVARPRFLGFLQSGLRVPPDGFSVYDFWSTIAEGDFVVGEAKESSIRSPAYRLLHRLIANSIYHRAGSEKVNSTDLFYLWSLVTPGRRLNLPYFLAIFLSGLALGTRHNSPICGGHFVTRLARSFDILTPEVVRSLICYAPKPLGLSQMDTMGFIHRGQGGHIEIPGDHPVEQAGEVQQPPARRRRRASPPPTQQPHTQTSTRSRRDRPPPQADASLESRIMAEMAILREQNEWVGEHLSILFAERGLQVRRPFPHSRAPADEAGPSGTRQESDDDS